MRNTLVLLVLFGLLLGCSEKQRLEPAQKDKSLTSFVNPFIGTGGHGHTYPGATLPFGMMQLSPDTRLDGWDGCSGYHYSDSYIYGFSHTHLSGTGVSDYGDILLMPTNALLFNNGADGKKGYRAHFSHDNEIATPGFYGVTLDSTHIEVALTVTKRAGMHKYMYPSADNQIVILDLEHRDKLLQHNITLVSNTEVQGYRFSDAWAKEQQLYFNLKTSKPFTILGQNTQTFSEETTKIGLLFDNPTNEPIYVSIGISAVDEAGAKKNREEEIGDSSFEQLKIAAENSWERQLEKIIVETQSNDDKINFYTSLYHTMLAPNLYQDVDGRYRGMDLEVHSTTAFDYYTVFSLWDTYRAAHPLYTIIETERTNDFINTFLAKYDEGGIMPIWDLSANYTGCMIGYHAVPVIADAYLKGIRSYDANKALNAMKHSAMQQHLGLASYKKFGYIPVEEESESVSKTLEYAYDDWTIAAMAKEIGQHEDYRLFSERAQYYKNSYDPETKFMRGRFRNTWFAPFDPYEVNFNYTEANAWQYSLYVPQDISGLMSLMGGKDKLEEHLDTLFTAATQTSGRDQADITGLIGQYAHGNEPSHHMAYLYNFVNKPHKTQEKVHQILTELYTNEPDGISGNEDCGQMSAWYVFSAMGFYPVTPGSNQYIIGNPLLDRATINLENGAQFTIVAHNRSNANHYIEKVVLNGSELSRTYLEHSEIMEGGTLEFYMTNSPSSWGASEGEEPVTAIVDHSIVPAPFIASGEVAFKDTTEVTLAVATAATDIFYSIDDSEFKKYESPITITEATELTVFAKKEDTQSAEISTQFYKIDPNLSISLETDYANQYNGGGNDALIDGIRGAKDFRTGAWQGYQDTDVIATVDMGTSKTINSIAVNFLQDQRSWIFYPTQVQCLVSNDGTNFTLLGERSIAAETPSEETRIKTIQFDQPTTPYRYIKIIAKNLGDLPDWHLGAPYDGTAWIFIDEIEIN